MKKKNERELWDKTDVKIFILFLLDNLQYPLDLDTLNRIVHETGYVGGFDFAECFSELLDDGHIIGDEVDGVAYYQVSSTGRMVAKQLQSELLDEIREESMICAARLLSLKARGASLHTSVEPREDVRALRHFQRERAKARDDLPGSALGPDGGDRLSPALIRRGGIAFFAFFRASRIF